MQYSREVLEHFSNPRNMGEIKDPDGVGQVGNLKCGDVMKVFIRVGTRIKTSNPKSKISFDSELEGSSLRVKDLNPKKTEEFIEDIKFQTLGCAAAIASSSMMTELARGKSLEEAEKICRDDINEALGKLPAQKYHCSILSADAIKSAIADYKRKKHL